MQLRYIFLDPNNNLIYDFDIYHIFGSKEKHITVIAKSLDTKKGAGMWEFSGHTDFDQLPFSISFKNYLKKFIRNIAFT